MYIFIHPAISPVADNAVVWNLQSTVGVGVETPVKWRSLGCTLIIVPDIFIDVILESLEH